jgi:hypothetical protein
MLFYQGQQQRQFANIKLAVAVGIKDKLFFSCLKTGSQGGPIAEVGLMAYDFYPAVSVSNCFGNSSRGVGTAVVNDNYFKVKI